jgi:hypothetical protein
MLSYSNIRPDYIASAAHIFTSTKRGQKNNFAIGFSAMSVGTLDAFFGQRPRVHGFSDAKPIAASRSSSGKALRIAAIRRAFSISLPSLGFI